MTKKIYIIFALLLCFELSMAQDKNGHNPYNDGSSIYSNQKTGIDPIPTAPPTPPAPIPIDGGVGFLIVAGLGYGVRKFRKKHN